MNIHDDRLLVELLESRLAQEAAVYRKRIDQSKGAEKHDKTYFTKFVSETLISEFKKWIYLRVNKLNNFEINKFLTLSIDQFNSFKPESRKSKIEKLYIIELWHPETAPNNKLSKYEKSFLQTAIRPYERFFSTFLSITEKALIDFKAGIIGVSTTFQSVPPSEQNKDKISFRDFKNFLSHLEYNYPYRVDVISFKYNIAEDVDYLKKEILNNFISISTEEKIAYLDRLKYELETFTAYANTKEEDIKVFLYKYNITEDEIFSHKKIDNDLYNILSNEPPSFSETSAPEYNQDTAVAQTTFYNYYYGCAINQILEYIAEHEAKVSAALNPVKPYAKIKTNLSVSQLAFMFRALFDNKIIPASNKTELFKTIAEVFQTKGKDDPSKNSIKNKFDTPDTNAVEFWDEKFLHLKQYTHKNKDVF